jgi:xanthine dehydrogenase molybdenum-binding subunit
MPEYSVVNQRLPRIDALSKVTGSAIFSSDVILPGMLHGAILRGPYPHARIRRLDTSRAALVEGVKAVITAADVPGYKVKNPLLFQEMPHLANEKIVYAEQPVAVVAATSLEIARKALELIEVDYEELTPILDIEEAVKAETPAIHCDLVPNIIAGDQPGPAEKQSNISFIIKLDKGDVEAGFKLSDVVLENTYRTAAVIHGYLEPISSLAAIDPSGKITIWTQSAGTFIAREMIADYLALPVSKIKLVPVEIGGAFGGKTYLPLAPLCALLAMKTGLPVRMEMSREEAMKDGRLGAGSLTTVKMGATKTGRITAASVSIMYDAGAYPEMSNAMIFGYNALGQYQIPNLKIEARDVITNKIPAFFYRAPSAPQSTFAVESQIDLLARALQIDPLQMRLKNIAKEGDLSLMGRPLPRVAFRETLEKMAEQLKDRPAPSGRNRGRGVACGFWNGATGSFGAYIHFNPDGTVNLILGVTDVSGSRTSLAQIAAEELGVPLEAVTVSIGDTDTAPYASMSTGSQTVYSAGMAVYRACQDVIQQFRDYAASDLGVDASSLEYQRGLFRVKGEVQKSISLVELAQSALVFRGPGPVLGRGSAGGMPPAPTLSVHAADIEVDEESGKVRILNYLAVQDVGLAINPTSVEGQVQGAVAQGVGWAFMEKCAFRNGKLLNPNLLDYRIPTALDVPKVQITLVESGSATGTYGLKHVGEPPIIPTLATLANAVHSATGVRFKELPMDPEAVLKGIKKQLLRK